MSTAPDRLEIETLPHVQQHLDSLAGSREAEARAGDLMMRGFAADESRPVSDPAPFGFSEEPATEDGTEAPTLDDKLDRLFGAEPKQPPPQAPKPKAEAAPARPEPARPEVSLDGAMFSVEDAETYATYKFELGRVNSDIEAFNKEVAELWSRTAPSNQAEVAFQIAQARQSLESRSAAVDRLGEQILGSLKDRVGSAAKQKVSGERSRLLKAFPDYDESRAIADLRARGFSDEQIRKEASAEVLIAFEESRRYREMKRQQKPNRVRRVTPAQGRSADTAKLQRANQTGNHDGVAGALDRRLSEIFR